MTVGKKPETTSLPLDDIRIDGNTQARVGLDELTVDRYAEAYGNGKDLPAVIIFFDGSDNWLGDGFHRYHGRRKAGYPDIACEIRKGTRRDALLYAIGANEEHGLPRTTLDRRRAVELLLDDAEWGAASTQWIAEAAKVSWSFADRIRKERGPKPETVNGRDGRQQTARPKKPASRTAEEEPSPSPSPASLPETEASPPPARQVEVSTDHLGRPLPEGLVEAFATGEAIQAVFLALGRIKGELERLHERAGGQWLHLPSILTDLSNAQGEVKFAIPYCVCPRCDGAGCEPVNGKAPICRGLGFLPKQQFEQLTVEEKATCESFRSE